MATICALTLTMAGSAAARQDRAAPIPPNAAAAAAKLFSVAATADRAAHGWRFGSPPFAGQRPRLGHRASPDRTPDLVWGQLRAGALSLAMY
jgi:hypothetical protein